ncbi:MAG: aspartyl-phosphate phosphatase Spo0E family protein [Clostridia bacterium]|nr:aspartyl-phosphate phosphatase Spo0E family protein [Clostridia bacterium]
MLDEKICELRDKLNESVISGEDYEIVYDLSIKLDALIAEYYSAVCQ